MDEQLCEVIDVLTQKDKARGYHPTLIKIDWTGLTTAQERIMARCFILHVIQSKFRHEDGDIPITYKAIARNMIHEEIRLPLRYQVRKKKELWEELLESLSDEEREFLLKELEVKT